MLKKKKKKRFDDPMNPLWLKVMVVAFIAFAAYSFYKDGGLNSSKPMKVGGQIVNPGTSVTVAGRQVAYKNYGKNYNIKIGGDIAGTGAMAQCGERATVKVEIILPESLQNINQEALPKPLKPVPSRTIKIGEMTQDQIWSGGLIGMRDGGVREVIVPAAALLDEDIMAQHGVENAELIRFKIYLSNINPTIPSQNMPFYASDSALGKGAIAFCGSKALVGLDIWGIDGAKIYSSRNEKDTKGGIAMTIGNADILYGIDRGVLAMRSGGKRKLIIPTEYITNNAGESSELSSLQQKILTLLPKNQMIIVDLSLLSVEKAK